MAVKLLAGPPFKAVLFFRGQAGAIAYGWSETYWVQAPTLQAAGAVVQQIPEVNTLIALRANFLCTDCVIDYYRISDPANPRLVNAGLPGFAPYQGAYVPTIGATVKTNVHPQLALLEKEHSNDFYTAFRWFRGIPGGVVSADGVYAPDAAFALAIGLFANFLEANTRIVSVKLKVNVPTIKTISYMDTVGIRARRIGRPFELLRGRRRAG